MDGRELMLTQLFDALSNQDVDAALAMLHPDADVDNGMEGGRVVGHEALRAYFQQTYGVIRFQSTLISAEDQPDGSVLARVHQYVTSLDDKLWGDEAGLYRFEFKDGLISRLDILDEPPG